MKHGTLLPGNNQPLHIALYMLLGGVASFDLWMVTVWLILPWWRRLVFRLDEWGSSRARLCSMPAADRPFFERGLAVTELYVALMEQARLTGLHVDEFKTETAAYWPDRRDAWLKPDAFVKLARNHDTGYWWYKIDLPGEPLPIVRAGLMPYLEFAKDGQAGPDGMVPRVLIGVSTVQRQAVLWAVVHSLPEPAEMMFVVALLPDVATVMAGELVK